MNGLIVDAVLLQSFQIMLLRLELVGAVGRVRHRWKPVLVNCLQVKHHTSRLVVLLLCFHLKVHLLKLFLLLQFVCRPSLHNCFYFRLGVLNNFICPSLLGLEQLYSIVKAYDVELDPLPRLPYLTHGHGLIHLHLQVLVLLVVIVASRLRVEWS